MKLIQLFGANLLTRLLLVAAGLFGIGHSAAADTVVKFNLVGVDYGGSFLDGTFTYNFTTGHWVTCSFLGGAINGNPLVSPVTITPSTITGDYSTQGYSYSFEILLTTPFTPTAGSTVAVDPAGTPPDQLMSYFVVDDGQGNPNSVVTYPITGGSVVPVDSGTAFCFGDGSQLLPCPCANTGAVGHGCDNSSGTGGALLTSIGATSMYFDSVQFTSSGEKPSATSIFLQGSTQISGVVFGQGVRCVGGTLVRLYVKNASGGVAVAPIGADPSVHLRSAALGNTITPGSSRYYQTYYRDPTVLGSCPTASTFNVSQGLTILWSS